MTRIAIIQIALLMMLAGCATDSVQPKMDRINNLLFVPGCFYMEHDRWPTNINELLEYARKEKIPFSTTNYSEITIYPQTNGSLKMTYTLAPPAKGNTTVIIPKPQEIIKGKTGSDLEIILKEKGAREKPD